MSKPTRSALDEAAHDAVTAHLASQYDPSFGHMTLVAVTELVSDSDGGMYARALPADGEAPYSAGNPYVQLFAGEEAAEAEAAHHIANGWMASVDHQAVELAGADGRFFRGFCWSVASWPLVEVPDGE